jgi:hypothetical protein
MSASSENEVTDWVEVIKTAIFGKGDLNKQAVLIQDKLKKTGHDIPPEHLDFDDSGVIGTGTNIPTHIISSNSKVHLES